MVSGTRSRDGEGLVVRLSINGGYMKPFSSKLRKKGDVTPISATGLKSCVPKPSGEALIRDYGEAVLLADALCEGLRKRIDLNFAHIPIQPDRILELLAD